jgi:Fe2+ transport system protein B
MIIPTVVLSYVILYAGGNMAPFFQDLRVLIRDIGIVFLALLAYGALFSLLGAWMRHSILLGLAYAFGWEGIVALLPGFTRKLTITHYVQSIFPHEDTFSALSMLIGQRTPAMEAILTLVLLTVFFLGAACLIVREKEFVLEQ